jgi:small subunit ribosomal protein S5
MPPAKEAWNSKNMKEQEIDNKKDVINQAVPVAEAAVPAVEAKAAPSGKVTPGRRMRDSARRGGHGAGQGGGDRRGGRNGRGGEGRERIKPEFDSRIVDIRRVTRVTAGGRRMNFSVAVVVGDRKGRVGVGLGKGTDTALAVEKATREAKKHLIKVPLTAAGTIPHAIEAKLGGSMIKIFPAKGSGIVAGSSARAVIELAGIKDVCAKYLSGSTNSLNNARVAIAALERLVAIPRASLAAGK